MTPAVERLSPRHRECLRLVYQRRTTKEIALELGIAPGTASTYCTEAIGILGASDRRHAAQILHDHEMPPLEQGAPSAGVETDQPQETSSAPSGRPAHILGPLAPANRDADNDASITARLAWVLLLAIGLAVAFGSIVGAVRTISDVVRDRQHTPR